MVLALKAALVASYGSRSPFSFLANWFMRTGVWEDTGEWSDAAIWPLTWFLFSGSWNLNTYWSDTEAW